MKCLEKLAEEQDSYAYRFSDFYTPIKGFFDYLGRNPDQMDPFSTKPTGRQELRTTLLALYHFVPLYYLIVGGLDFLVK